MACTAAAPEKMGIAARNLLRQSDRQWLAFPGLARTRELVVEAIYRHQGVLPRVFHIVLLDLLQMSEIPLCTLFFLFEFLTTDFPLIARRIENSGTYQTLSLLNAFISLCL